MAEWDSVAKSSDFFPQSVHDGENDAAQLSVAVVGSGGSISNGGRGPRHASDKRAPARPRQQSSSLLLSEEATFDLSVPPISQSHSNSNNQRVSNFCINCRTQAKYAPPQTTSQPTTYPVHDARCRTPGCPGYTGHAPSTHLLAKPSNGGWKGHGPLDDDSVDSSSDDIPLLLQGSRGSSDPSLNSHASSEEMGTLDHCHSLVSPVTERRQKTAATARRKLIIASVLCLMFIVGEVIGGYLSNSLAIMTDAAHMFSDFASFCIGILAIWLGNRSASKKYTYGYYRAEPLGALFTVIILWYMTGVLFFAAIKRVASPDFDVEPIPMMVVACCAILFNLGLALLLRGTHAHGHSHGGGGGHAHLVNNNPDDEEDLEHGHSHGGGGGANQEQHINIRAALIHVMGDFIQSIGVLVSSIIIKLRPEWKIADPICTIMFSVIVLCTTLTVIKDSIFILMERAPSSLHYDDVLQTLMNVEGVVRVHDLRLWSLTSDRTALSCHLAANSNESNSSERVLQEAMRALRKKHNIAVTTLQVEDYKPMVMNMCEQCQFIQ